MGQEEGQQVLGPSNDERKKYTRMGVVWMPCLMRHLFCSLFCTSRRLEQTWLLNFLIFKETKQISEACYAIAFDFKKCSCEESSARSREHRRKSEAEAKVRRTGGCEGQEQRKRSTE